MNGSIIGGIQALHRLKQDSPGLLRQKHVPSRESSFNQRGHTRNEVTDTSRANSIVDLNGSELHLSALLHPRQSGATVKKGGSSDFGCSNPNIAAGGRARQWADRGKNGLKSLDESVRPLLRDTDATNCNGGDGNLAALAEDVAAKRWRSCDEITSSRPTRDRLKNVFAGLLRVGATHEKVAHQPGETSCGIALPKIIQDECGDPSESIV